MKLTRSRILNSSYVLWTYKGILTQEEASEVQNKAGFHVCGYGFYSYNVKDGVTTWESSSSCD